MIKMCPVASLIEQVYHAATWCWSWRCLYGVCKGLSQLMLPSLEKLDQRFAWGPRRDNQLALGLQGNTC